MTSELASRTLNGPASSISTPTGNASVGASAGAAAAVAQRLSITPPDRRQTSPGLSPPLTPYSGAASGMRPEPAFGSRPLTVFKLLPEGFPRDKNEKFDKLLAVFALKELPGPDDLPDVCPLENLADAFKEIQSGNCVNRVNSLALFVPVSWPLFLTIMRERTTKTN